MNRYYIGIIVISMSIITLLLSSQEKTIQDKKIIILNKENLIAGKNVDLLLSPDKLWEAQQQKKRIDITPKSTKEITVAVQQLELSTKTSIISSDNLTNPDKIWEEQRNENFDFDLPATTPDDPVVSEEQLESELAYRNSIKENDDSSLIDEMVEKKNDLFSDEFPAIESSEDVIPFELKELEASSKTKLEFTKQEEYQDPLLDLDTGLSDKVMRTPDTESPIEPEPNDLIN